jgi:tRNA (mo5U34)-methyltransferase
MPILRTLAARVPRIRRHLARVEALRQERDRLAAELAELRRMLAAPAPQGAGSSAQDVSVETETLKRRKQSISEEFKMTASTGRLSNPVAPMPGHRTETLESWIRHKVEAEPYWFQRVELFPGYFSPGWSDPVTEKLPFFGLPDDLSGMRVLDIGCAEGFFAFEAEKRGAREVIAIDSFPDSVRRFNIVREARQSNAVAFLANVYDLEPKRLGTFDLVLFYGVFYHLKHPQLALERILSVCSGQMLFQTATADEPTLRGVPWARFYPHGFMSGKNRELWDPSVFWMFNGACCKAMLDHVGFCEIETVSSEPHPFVLRAKSPNQTPGAPPDQSQAPWC